MKLNTAVISGLVILLGADGSAAPPRITFAPQQHRSTPLFRLESHPPRWFALENADNPSYWTGVRSDRIILRMRQDVSVLHPDIQSFLKQYGATGIVARSKHPHMINFVVVNLPEGTPDRALSLIREAKIIAQIVYAEPEAVRQPDRFVPDDPLWQNQWGPKVFLFDSAWTYTRGDASVWIAVLDEGIDWWHEDLTDNVLYGHDYFDDDDDPTPNAPDETHGTHVAGTVGATLNNGSGVAGMANVTIFAARVADTSGFPTAPWVNAILDICQAPEIRAANMSFGGSSPIALEEEACDTAWNRGLLMIAASGNAGSSAPHYPCGYTPVVAVGAIGTDGANLFLASYSNYGSKQELTAPGGSSPDWGIVSTQPENLYGEKSGTSMASPHVAGLAGLVFSANPGLSHTQVRKILRDNAFDDMTYPGWDQYFGYGMINAAGSVKNALSAVFEHGPAAATGFSCSLRPTIITRGRTASLRFSLGARSVVRIAAYDALGRLATALLNRELEPGRHDCTVRFDGVSRGVYFITLHGGGNRSVNKIVVE